MQVHDLGAQPISFLGSTLAVFDLPDGKTSDEWNKEKNPALPLAELEKDNYF